MTMTGFELTPEELKALQMNAAQEEDQTETSTEFERNIPLPGKRLCRLIEYVEQGMHQQKPGKFGQKPPAEQVRLVFELLGPYDITEYKKEDGEVERHGHRLTIRMRKSKSNKSDFKKVLNRLIGGREGIVNFAQLVGQGFIVKCTATDAEGNIVTPAKPKEADAEYKAKAKYLNAWSGEKDAKEWTFELPMREDPETGDITPINCPVPTYQLRMFLWNMPGDAKKLRPVYLKMWHSLYIDGTRSTKDEQGKEVQVSKNFLQEEMLKAVNFPGSALEIMLMEEGILEDTLRAAGLLRASALPTDDGGLDATPSGLEDLGPAFPSEAANMGEVPF